MSLSLVVKELRGEAQCCGEQRPIGRDSGASTSEAKTFITNNLHILLRACAVMEALSGNSQFVLCDGSLCDLESCTIDDQYVVRMCQFLLLLTVILLATLFDNLLRSVILDLVSSTATCMHICFCHYVSGTGGRYMNDCTVWSVTGGKIVDG